jgi:hypothetical protein
MNDKGCSGKVQFTGKSAPDYLEPIRDLLQKPIGGLSVTALFSARACGKRLFHCCCSRFCTEPACNCTQKRRRSTQTLPTPNSGSTRTLNTQHACISTVESINKGGIEKNHSYSQPSQHAAENSKPQLTATKLQTQQTQTHHSTMSLAT